MPRFLPVLACCLATGCFDPSALQVTTEETADNEPAGPVDPVAAVDGDAPDAVITPTFPDVPAQVVDKQVALAENPNLRETENAIDAMDPASAAAQSYFALGSRIHLLNFKHQIDLYQAEHDRFPTFDEFAEMMRIHQVEFKGLKPWQMYAYDSSDGTVCILEDPEVKRARYEEAGLEYEE